MVVNGILPLGTTGKWPYGGQEPMICVPCQDQSALESGGGVLYSGHSGATTGSTPRVYYSTGEEVKTLPICTIPGVGIDLNFTLTYRSRVDFKYRYGNGWSLNQDSRIRVETSGDRTFFNGSGRRDVYVQSGGSWIPPHLYSSSLGVVGATSTITDRFGQVSTYNATGLRTSVADRYGPAGPVAARGCGAIDSLGWRP